MLAIGLLSGGLDSSLAVKLVMDQGIEVVALKFTSPFCQCDSGGCCHAAELAKKLGIKLINVPKGQEYLDLVCNPKFGRGSGMNPCIDCRIYMLKRAREVADDIGAKFLFTGEVVGQRPMSQHRSTLKLIEKEAGLEGKLVRPLSAKLLTETEAERERWIDRGALLDISGRGRKTQIRMAKEGGIDYPCPAGGCLLTSKEFSAKLKDFLKHSPDRLTTQDVALLKVGRHFRVNGSKTIIGRNQTENERLRSFAKDGFTMLETISVPGPVALIEKGSDIDRLNIAAAMLARYSDHNGKEVKIKVQSCDKERLLKISPASLYDIDAYRIGNDYDRIVPLESMSTKVQDNQYDFISHIS